MNNLEKYLDRMIQQKAVNPTVPIESKSEPDNEVTPNLILAILRRWYIVLLTSFVICAIGIPAIWLLTEPLYNVTGAIRVAPIIPNILTGKSDSGDISNYQTFMYTQAEMITSDPIVQRVADNLADKNLTFFKNATTDISTKLKQTLKNAKMNHDPASILKQAISAGIIYVAPARYTELMKITMRSKNTKEAKQIVDAFINAYMAIEVSNSAENEDQKLTLLENERKVLSEKLQSRHQAIHQLAEEYGTRDLDRRQEMRLQRVTTLLSELTKTESQRINLEAQVQFLERAKEQSIAPEELLKMRNEFSNSDPIILELTRSIVQLERDLIVAKQTMMPENPALKQKQELLDAFQLRLEEKRQELAKKFDDMVSEQINKAGKQNLIDVQTKLEQTKVYENRLKEVLANEDTQTIEIGRKQLNIQDLQFQLKLDEEIYDTVRRRIQELEMERKRPARVSVAYNADVAFVRDKRVKYTLAFMFGAMACGSLLAFLRDKADLSLRTPDDVAKCIGIRIIGTTTSSHTVKPTLLPGQIAADFQTIRANLGLLDGGGIPKKLAITSPGMREGKTTLAINLAISMSKSGKRVLLIDGDLRKPDIARMLNLPHSSRGLQDVLFGIKFDQAICTMASIGIDVLAADSRNSTDAYELLASPLTARYINTVSQNYDHVIIDTPPLLAFPDTLVWSKIADAVILTSLAGQTTAPDLKDAKVRLAEINVRVLGTVLSNVRAEQSYYRYGYNYYTQNDSSRKNGRQANTKLLLTTQSWKNSTKI